MIASSQQRLTGRRAERRGVEPIVTEPIRCEPLKVRRLARTTKGAGCAKTDIIEQDDESIGGARGRTQFPDRRILRFRIFGVVGCQSYVRLLRDGKDRPLNRAL